MQRDSELGSETELHAELHHTRTADAVRDLAEVRSGFADDVFRERVIDRVEHVEDVPTGFNTRRSPELEGPCQAEVQAALPEPAQHVATEIAESQIVRVSAGQAAGRAEDGRVERRLRRIAAGLAELIERPAEAGPAERQTIQAARPPNQVGVMAGAGNLRLR